MNTLSGDGLLYMLEHLSLPSLVSLSQACWEMNDWLTYLLDASAPGWCKWWEQKLESYHESSVYPNVRSVLLPNEACVLLAFGPAAAVEFARQQHREEMFSYVVRMSRVCFSLTNRSWTKHTGSIALSYREVVRLLKSQEYGLICTAIRESRGFPLQEVLSTEDNLALLEGVIDEETPSSCVVGLLQDVMRYSTHSTMELLTPGVLSRIASHRATLEGSTLNACFYKQRGRGDTLALALISHLPIVNGRKAGIDDHLLTAIIHKRLPVVQRLLREGTDPNYREGERNRSSALELAIHVKSQSIIQALMSSEFFTLPAPVSKDVVRRTRGELNALLHSLMKEGKIAART